MSRFTIFVSWCLATLTAVFVLASSSVKTWLKTTKFNDLDTQIIIFVLAIFGLRLSEVILKWFVGNSKTIRHLLLGKTFIEGYWFDVVLDKKSTKVKEFALVTIGFEDGQFTINGRLYDENLREIGSFGSTLSKFDKGQLKYGYWRRSQHDEIDETFGTGTYRFHPDLPYSLSFTGSFFDPALETLRSVEGFRITETPQIKKMQTKYLGDALTVLGKCVELYKNKFPERFSLS